MKSCDGCAVVFDLGSQYAKLSKLSDRRDARGIRSQLNNLMGFILVAKLCGEDHPSGIAEWVMHRIDLMTKALQIKRKIAPHHSTYRRILSDMD